MPGALGRALRLLDTRLGAAAIDRVWVFPPMIRGRKEWGLVAASVFHESPDRRRLVTASYTAERTGQGPVVDARTSEEGEAPPDRLPRIMEGVARRSPHELGAPREVEIGGDPVRLEHLLSELESP